MESGNLEANCTGTVPTEVVKMIAVTTKEEFAGENYAVRMRKEENLGIEELECREREQTEMDNFKKRSRLEQKRQEKEREREEKLKKKQIEEAEKNRKRKELEARKLAIEAERAERQKQKEMERAERRRKKEVEDAGRELKRKKREDEEAAKEHKRKEKEEKELREQKLLKKQANVLCKFLVIGKPPEKPTSLQEETQCLDTMPRERQKEVALAMDKQLQPDASSSTDCSLRAHQMNWKTRVSQNSNSCSRWGTRRKPKTQVVHELRLESHPNQNTNDKLDNDEAGCSGFRDLQVQGDLNMSPRKVENGDLPGDFESTRGEMDYRRKMPPKRRKLLQFHENNRPPFWGSCSQCSNLLSGRHPLRRDDNLDYNIDSDEEWEEEDPGESLLESEKEDDEDVTEGVEDEEVADGFVVPDGYLSEDEGFLQEGFDERGAACGEDTVISKVGLTGVEAVAKEDLKLRKFRQLFDLAVEKALRANRPLVISNFGVSKKAVNLGEPSRISQSGGPGTLELGFLQALSVTVTAPLVAIEITTAKHDNVGGNQESKPQTARRGRPVSKGLPEEAVPDLVKFLIASTNGMKRIIETLSEVYPSVAKAQLELKIRQVANFSGGCWQVKPDVLQRLGMLTSSPEPEVDGPSSDTPHACPAPITRYFPTSPVKCSPAQRCT